MEIAIVIADSNSSCPVPAVKGGAVATLVDNLIKENSKENKCNFCVFTYFDKEAEKLSKSYNNVVFSWVKIPLLIKWVDAISFWLISHLCRNGKLISYRHIFSLLFFICIVSFRLHKKNYDRIVLENNIMLSWVMRLYGNYKKYAGKYYYHLHNIPRINGNNAKIFANIEKYLCVSKFVGQCIQKEDNPIGPVPKTSIRVLKNCIDTSIFNSNTISIERVNSLREEYCISNNDIVIVFVGRLSREKGLEQVLYSLEYLKDLPIRLIIAGSSMISGNIADEYIAKIEKIISGYGKKIVFTGFISPKEISNLYHLADFAVLPSMWEEPAGLTMIEAMSCGTIVVTTNSGGIPEYTENGASIILERDNNLPQRIAETIRYYCMHKSEAKLLGDRGAKLIQQKYNLATYLDNFLNCLDVSI